MEKFIPRTMAATITEAAEFFPVICVTGPRQSGKSTLIKHLFSSYKRYTLEDYDVRLFAMNDPVAFLNQNEEGMVIDEVQNVPELLSYIQGIVDESPEKRFILSGSSNFTLLKGVSQSLAGRVGIFELLPMSYDEARAEMSGLSLDELLYNGLYPAICAGKNKAKYLYPSYVKTYLDKDVLTQLKITDMMQFNTFLRLCAGRIGSIFNASEVAAEVGVAANTIKNWLSVLEASYIIMRLQPWSENTGKRLIKSPKLYFCDTGLACYLLGIESAAQLSRDKMRGHLFENFIVMEALKHCYNQGKDNTLYFYRDSNANEIDLLIHEEGMLKAIEIKSSMTYSPSFESVLKRTDTLIKTPISYKGIVYAGDLENSLANIKLLNYKHFQQALDFRPGAALNL